MQKGYSDVITFNEYYKKFHYPTRVIALYYDKDEYKQEYKDLKEAARFFATRESLRIGYVDDVKTIKKLKNKYGVLFFSTVSMSSMS